jgi:type I restriction enzyme S subunit
MNADRLLSHFDRISDAPDAVDRLRRFILDLAVRGKLVEQDTRDGTATDLLAQHRLVVESSGEMQPFPLPDSWAWVPVGVVCSKTGSGSTPRGGKAAYVSKGIPFLRSQNVHDDGLTLDDVAYIDGATHGKMIGTAVQPDDLLLNITGGSMGRCCHVSSSFKEGNVSQHVAILRVAIPGTQAFLHKCIISPFFQGLIFDEQTGAGRGGLPKNKMDRLPVPLPPLAEQKRIVEKVDELMLLCDRLEASQAEREGRRDRLVKASLNRLSQPTDPDEFKKDASFRLSNLNRLSTKPDHIKELRKAILNLAVRGKLVPQDERERTAEKNRHAEDGQMLLDRILSERREKWGQEQVARFKEKGKEPPKNWQSIYKEPLAPDNSELSELPEGWVWASVDQLVASVTTGATPSRTNSAFWEDGTIPWVTSSVVNKETVNSATEFITELALKQTNVKLFPSGTLLVALYGEGKTRGKVTELLISATTNQACAALLFGESEALLRPFIKLFFRHNYDSMRRLAAGGVQPNLSVSLIRESFIPLPPLAEQKRIVAKVDELMLICDQLEKQLDSQRKGRRQLLEALLHEALEGVG